MLSFRGENPSSKYLPHNYVCALSSMLLNIFGPKQVSSLAPPSAHARTAQSRQLCLHRPPPPTEVRTQTPEPSFSDSRVQLPALTLRMRTPSTISILSSYQPGCPLSRSVGRAVGPPGLSRARLSVRANLGSQHPAPILKHIRHDSSGANLASTSSQHQTGCSMQTELSQEAGPQPAPTHYTHTHIHTFTHTHTNGCTAG